MKLGARRCLGVGITLQNTAKLAILSAAFTAGRQFGLLHCIRPPTHKSSLSFIRMMPYHRTLMLVTLVQSTLFPRYDKCTSSSKGKYEQQKSLGELNLLSRLNKLNKLQTRCLFRPWACSL